MIFNGTTVAFSTKANVWKTRYSFTPTCYMTMDNDFLSSNTKQDSRKLMWRHDQSFIYNSFYDNPMEPSSLEVVSNQNPSAVKIFKALSLETDAKVWRGSVYTNKTRDPFAYQSGDLKPFMQKEGNQYVDMPRSSINSSSNITFIGVVKVDDIVPTGLNSPSETWSIPLINLPDVAIPSSSSSNSYVYFGEGLISPDSNASPISASDGYEFSGAIVRSRGYEGSSNSIKVSLNAVTVGAITEIMTDFAGGFSVTEIPVYIMTNPVEDGDNMRGPYAGIKLISPNSSSAFELYSINVDYEKTKLDGSLG